MNAKELSTIVSEVYSSVLASFDNELPAMAMILCGEKDDQKVLIAPLYFTSEQVKDQLINMCRQLFIDNNGIGYGLISSGWVTRKAGAFSSETPEKEMSFIIESFINDQEYICIKSAITGKAITSSDDNAKLTSEVRLNDPPVAVPGDVFSTILLKSTMPELLEKACRKTRSIDKNPPVFH